MTIHATLEEDIFYPAVERKLGRDGAKLIKEALEEHAEMKRAISNLRASESAGPECDQVFQDTMKDVQHHVKEEENEMLPKAQQQLGAESDVWVRRCSNVNKNFSTLTQALADRNVKRSRLQRNPIALLNL